MFSFFSAGRARRREGFLPVTDFKIGRFTLGGGSREPRQSSDAAYTAITPSDDTAVEIPMAQRNAERRGSIGSVDDFAGTTSLPPGYKAPSYYSAFLGVTHRRAKSSSLRCKCLILACILLPILYISAYVTFRPPNYIVLPPETYVKTLRETADKYVPIKAARELVLRQLLHIEESSDISKKAPYDPESEFPLQRSVVPKTLWSSDGKPAASEWHTTWSEMGFEPKFLDDAGAEAWVETNFANTSIKAMWDAMPRFILKVDLLRYLLLLVEGGTWSDMDTKPLMPLGDWTKDVVPLSKVLADGSDLIGRVALEPEPIRAVIGIEDDPELDPSPRNFLERWRLLPMRRHRPLQFVQWTLHAAPSHPIMVDVIRRILQASEVYRAYEIEQEREGFADGWGWNEKSSEDRDEQRKLREAHRVDPWDAFSMSWKWQAGHWRWGWDHLAIEEWTGPAVFTDSVVSYLYASAGVRPEDLSGLKRPVQIRDIVILPLNGFHPVNGFLGFGDGQMKEGESRVVHMFRGSWKGATE